MRHHSLLYIIFCICNFSLSSASGAGLLAPPSYQHIFVNNRVLAKVNGTPITVVDVMKKMDMLFYRQFPQYAGMVEARFQFYHTNWKFVLEEMVEKELFLADAAQSKIEISHGDVRQEMENIFGPNMVVNLEKAGLTYEEALKMVREEMTMRRLLGGRVQVKAYRAVTPQVVKEAYNEYVRDHITPETWTYRVISTRGKEQNEVAEASRRIHELLTQEKVPLERVLFTMESENSVSKETKTSLSEPMTHREKEISEGYREALFSLDKGCYSGPCQQKSRAKNEVLYRIFYLQDYNPPLAPPFSEVEQKLRNSLIEKQTAELTREYVEKLKKRFTVQEGVEYSMYSEEFEPFTLR